MDLINKIIQYFSQLSAQAILRIGSTINPQITDFWSDTDIVILLDQSAELDSIPLQPLLAQLGTVVAKEEHRNEEAYTIRIVIAVKDKVERLDLTVLSDSFLQRKGGLPYATFELLYGEINAPILAPTPLARYPFDKKRVEQIWFLCYECVKKFGRKDHLIGLHLLLELIQYYLSLQMQARDVQYQTNIHRFGDEEQLPIELSLDQLASLQLNALLKYMESLTTALDQTLSQRFVEYQSPLSYFLAYLNKCKANSTNRL